MLSHILTWALGTAQHGEGGSANFSKPCDTRGERITRAWAAVLTKHCRRT